MRKSAAWGAGLLFLPLSACGGGGTTDTNYSDPPPMAEIVATPSPKSATPEAPAVPEAQGADDAAGANIDTVPADNAAM